MNVCVASPASPITSLIMKAHLPFFSFQSQTHPWKERGDSSLPFDICEGSSKKLLLRSRNQCLAVIPRWELLHHGNYFNLHYLPHATSSPLFSHLGCLRGQRPRFSLRELFLVLKSVSDFCQENRWPVVLDHK